MSRTVDLLKYIAEDISLGFDRWTNRYVRGPSLYFLVLSEARFDPFADPLGNNRWPIDRARAVPEDFRSAVRVAAEVAFDCDGAIVLAADGTFQEQMVRVRSVPDDTMLGSDYPDWMSAKHLSAFEISGRDAVLAAVTLSEEDGRVTVFEDGDYRDRQRDELGDPWRAAPTETTDEADRPNGGADP